MTADTTRMKNDETSVAWWMAALVAYVRGGSPLVDDVALTLACVAAMATA